MTIMKVCVLGSGIMGAGIAQIPAQADFEGVLRDIEDRFVGKMKNRSITSKNQTKNFQ